MRNSSKIRICTLISTMVLFLLFSYDNETRGEENMHPLYSLNRALMLRLEPSIFPSSQKIEGVFDVPVDNSIATNKIGNAITLIHFVGEKIKFKTVKKNFLDYVSGGNNGFMPIFSDDTIGYSIGRGFLLFNIKNKTFNYYSIAGNFDYKLSQSRVLDSDKKLFLFKIRDLKRKQPTFLRLLDLSEKSAEIIREKEVGHCGIAIKNKQVFVYHKDTIRVLDSNLEEVEHPLVTIFKKEKKKEFGNIIELIIHPVFPLAILKEKKRGELGERIINIWAVTWRRNDLNTDKPSMIKLLNCEGYYFTFSYDGKWMYFDDSTRSPSSYILMPIDPELPHFIGKPIYLGDVPDYPSGAEAMTRNPSGLVVSECEGYSGKCWLKKWDFTEAERLLEKNR